MIKGLSVFMSAIFAFSEGGYLIIDEIENHFNREIVATLIRFFMDKKVNKNGATILFSNVIGFFKKSTVIMSGLL